MDNILIHSADQACEELNALTSADPESAHGEADDVVMEVLRLHNLSHVADAFERASERCGFWYA